MTAFTDDLDNDLEVLAENHEVTLVQVAKAALGLLPNHVRLPLLRALLEAMPQPVSEDPPDFIQPHTGLPQALRGAVHQLMRNHPPNLVVDAAMLELPEDVRRDVARAFLRSTSSTGQQAPRVKPPAQAELIDGETGEVLVVAEGPLMPRVFDYVDADGLTTRYTRPVSGDCHYQFGADGRSVMRATYSKEVIG